MQNLDYKLERMNADDILLWMSDNMNLLGSVSSILKYRMANFKLVEIINDDGYNSVSLGNFVTFIQKIFHDGKDYANNNTFSLLEELIRDLLSNEESDLSALSLETFKAYPSTMLIALCETKEDILNNNAIKELNTLALKGLYGYLLDFYIPCDNPQQTETIFANNFPIDELFTYLMEPESFRDAFVSKGLDKEYNFKEYLLLYAYISDIYTNREIKINVFTRILQYNGTVLKYRENMNIIYNRYTSYFGEDVYMLISDIINLYNSKEKEDEIIDEFLFQWSNKYGSLNYQIIRSLLFDITPMASYINKEYLKNKIQINQMIHKICELWGNEKYIHEEFHHEEYDDDPIEYLESIATEAVHRDSPKMNSAEKKIYKAYKTYQSAAEKVDSQVTKACRGLKKIVFGDAREEIIEGKKFTAMGLLKRLLGTVAIFSFGPIKGAIALVVGYATKAATKDSERRKIIMEIQTELNMIDEKIEDARSDGNRKAKYAMMRTKNELQNALQRIKYGMEADKKSLSGAHKLLNNVRDGKEY